MANIASCSRMLLFVSKWFHLHPILVMWFELCNLNPQISWDMIHETLGVSWKMQEVPICRPADHCVEEPYMGHKIWVLDFVGLFLWEMSACKVVYKYFVGLLPQKSFTNTFSSLGTTKHISRIDLPPLWARWSLGLVSSRRVCLSMVSKGNNKISFFSRNCIS